MHETGVAGRGGRVRVRARALAAALTFATLALAGAASAHHGDPIGDSPTKIGEPGEATVDTSTTPVAKPGDKAGWRQVAGSRWRRDGTITELAEDSPTPYDVDFFDVDFLDHENDFFVQFPAPFFWVIRQPHPPFFDDKNGLAVGAICRRTAYTEPVSPGDVAGCERVPAIWQYTDTVEKGPKWERVKLPGDDRRGYVGAVAWIAPGTALAVGGTGNYPRRSIAGNGDSVETYIARDEAGSEPNAAGMARAWLYSAGSWTELTDLPAGMRGLSAVGTTPRLSDCGPDAKLGCALAGGLGQLWEFRDERFLPQPVVSEGADRYRDIRFIPGDAELPADLSSGPSYRAATSSCCAGAVDPSAPVAAADSQYSIVIHRFDDREEAQHGSRLTITRLLSPGGPPQEQESGPKLEGGGVARPCDARDGTAFPGEGLPSTCSLRLVALDGEIRSITEDSLSSQATIRWGIGSLRSRGEGVAWGFKRPPSQTNPLTCAGDQAVVPLPELKTNTSFDTWTGACKHDAYLERQASKQLFGLSTYALNGVRVLDEAGVGWAVGDHGAIVRWGGGAATGAEPPTPVLGRRQRAALTQASDYEEFQAASSGTPGVVPFLAANGTEQLDERQFVPGGSPDNQTPSFTDPDKREIGNIVMSRDGREGWAFGPGEWGANLKGELHHYDGSSWRRCDPLGRVDEFGQPSAPDPACAGLAPLFEDRVSLHAAARIPFERDDNPANDDEFEVLAVGGLYRQGANDRIAVARYADGRWSLDRDTMDELAPFVDTFTNRGFDIVFSSPDDGWMTAGTQQRGPDRLFHYDGVRWVQCAGFGDAVACTDPDRRLPLVNVETHGTSERKLRLALVGQRLYLYATRDVALTSQTDEFYPLILFRDSGDPCEQAGDTGCWRGGVDTSADDLYNPTDGGWDPGCDPSKRNASGACVPTGRGEDQGRVFSVGVSMQGEKGYEGWATGQFGGADDAATSPMLRLTDAGWRVWTKRDAAYEELMGLTPTSQRLLNRHFALGGAGGDVIVSLGITGPNLVFNPERDRWEAMATPFKSYTHTSQYMAWHRADTRAIAPDNQGGLWLATRAFCPQSCHGGLYYYHYTARPQKPVFTDTPNPVSEGKITATAAGADGSYWIATDRGILYRYDRRTGWDQSRIPGWLPRGSTISRRVSAIAIGPDGSGVAVGDEGRIAEISGDSVSLDPAAGRSCSQSASPCGTGHDLKAAAVAPDGSALLAGEGRTFLWRPPGGGFQSVEPPQISTSQVPVGMVMPTPKSAFAVTASGIVHAGTMTSPGEWSWKVENVAPDGGSLTKDGNDSLGMSDIAVDASGYGLAVGEKGLVLERQGDGPHPWRRLDTRISVDLTSVALPVGGGPGALIGGNDGVVLTLTGGRFEPARHADSFDPTSGAQSNFAAKVVGVELIPGFEDGQVEAWAALQGHVGSMPSERESPLNNLLHYSSDPDDPLLNPLKVRTVLPDAPPTRSGELSFAALGNQVCQGFDSEQDPCKPMDGSLATDALAEGLLEEVGSAAERPGGPSFALFSGDAVDRAGDGEGITGLERNVKHRRWMELFAAPLDQRLPLFGTVGARDLTYPISCSSWLPCQHDAALDGQYGVNLGWRQAMEEMDAPWLAEERERGELSFELLPPSPLTQDVPNAETPASPVTGVNVGRTRTAGAPTHYATDVYRDDEPIARIVAVDTSLGGLTDSDAIQNPIEPDGQRGFLERMLCYEGSAADTNDDIRDCTREEGQAAIVLTNTPTYSYSDSIPPTETMRDAAVFEEVLLREDATVVVSGRLGWNGLYWATAPGVHEPCPGQQYQAEPPPPGTRICGREESELPEGAQARLDEAQRTADSVQGVPTGVLPFVVSSSAGGRLNTAAVEGGRATADRGFWRGYAIVRIPANADPRGVIVEQRPVLDWIAIRGENERALDPGSTTDLDGYGREPMAPDQSARYVELDTPGITHRYDLLLADPQEPWAACEAADPECASLAERLAGSRSFDSAPGTGSAQDDMGCDPYVCLPARVGSVDSASGKVKAGNGKYPDTYAIAMLSLGDHTASYPLVFKRSPSFVVNPAIGFPAIQPPPNETGTAQAPPSPPPAQTPPIPNVNAPAPPLPPPIAPLQAAQPPEPAPPAPPAPPPPTEQPSPLNLALAPPAITIATPTAVIQPPTPPVNPAPPGGARREARQRQAAAQKSGADNEEGGVNETQEMGGDTADAPPSARGSAFARHDRQKPEPSFTTIARADQPSAWAQGALYTGGIALIAAALAAGWIRGRPGPRPRSPAAPAQAQATAWRRR